MKLGTMLLTAFLVGMSLSPLQAKKAAITIKPQKLTLYVKQSKTLKLYKGKKSVKAKWKTGNKKKEEKESAESDQYSRPSKDTSNTSCNDNPNYDNDASRYANTNTFDQYNAYAKCRKAGRKTK